MDIRRSDVRRRNLRKHIMRYINAGRLQPGLVGRELLRRSLRSLDQKTGFLELQASWRINRPGSGELTGVAQANVEALVIGEIEIVIPELMLDPVGHADRRWALNVQADPRMQVWRNDWPVKQSARAHA